MGRVLRIKVLIDIRKPLMRGITVKVGNPEKEKWCSFAYEYLPDFCYTCGLVGHVDKICSLPRAKGEPQQFSRNLRFIPEKKRGESSEEKRYPGSKQRGFWNGGGSGSRSSFENRGDRWGSSGSGSDALNWRKKEGDRSIEKGEEVTSPEKVPGSGVVIDDGKGVKKPLLPLLGATATAVVADEERSGRVLDAEKRQEGKRGTFKRLDKSRLVKGDGGKREKSIKKRKMESDMEVEEDNAKKVKAAEVLEKEHTQTVEKAGPADRPCENQ